MFILFAGVLTKAKGQNTFPSTGNVGIGTVSPGYLLDVNNGDINISPSHSYRVNGQYGLFWDGNQNGIGLGTKNDFPVNVYANSAGV